LDLFRQVSVADGHSLPIGVARVRLGWWLGSQAAGVASQDSTITDFRIEGKGRAEGSATTGSETGSSNGRVLLRAGVRGAPAVLLSVTAQATASNLLPDSNTASAEYTFQIDIGDEDRDGLLDAWEDEGIDVDNDGTPEIDLPAFGADPRHKDVFVELDAMTGAAVDPQAIGMVEGAFDRAPAALIDNPDGQAGVSLHVDIDETSVPHQALSGGSWPSAFDTIESQALRLGDGSRLPRLGAREDGPAARVPLLPLGRHARALESLGSTVRPGA